MGRAGVYYCYTNNGMTINPGYCAEQLREVLQDPVAVIRIEEIVPISVEEYELHTQGSFNRV